MEGGFKRSLSSPSSGSSVTILDSFGSLDVCHAMEAVNDLSGGILNSGLRDGKS